MSYFGNTKIQEGAAGLGDSGPSSFMPPPVHAVREGSLGEYFSANGLGATNTFMRPGTRAFRDGSLGDDTFYRPSTRAYRQGSIGEYFSGVGALPSPTTLDLTNPATLKEFKAIMARVAPDGMAINADGVQYWDEAWYDNGIWDEKADELWAAIDAVYPIQAPSESISATVNGHQYPTVPGASAVVGAGMSAFGAEIFSSSFPNVNAWLAQASADPEGAAVGEPYFTLEETITGKKTGMAMSTMAWAGAAGVAVLGAALVFGGKKKKK